MTNKTYKNYNQSMVYCPHCGLDRPIEHFSYSNVSNTYHTGRCKVCDWFYRNKDHYIPDGWSTEELYTLVEFILLDDEFYINKLTGLIEKHSLRYVVEVVHNLNIGNKKTLVKCTCKTCGKSVDKHPCTFLKYQDIYCSKECYWVDKPNTIGKGKENPSYNRIATTCTYCGKNISVIPYSYNIVNSYGENNNFCSQKCYWNYRKIHYVGDKAASNNVKWTPELRNKMRLISLKNSRSSKRFDSKIQLKINSLLDEMNINFIREYVVKYYAIDNYLQDFHLMIEVMGDYWHANPLVFNENKYKLNKVQSRDILNDKQKHSYILNHNSIEILYLWESDIKKFQLKCKLIIDKYLKNHGNLPNYHSFNYNVINDKLFLSQNIIIPYQDMKAKEYSHLIKKEIS